MVKEQLIYRLLLRLERIKEEHLMGFAFQEMLEEINGEKGLRAASAQAKAEGKPYVPEKSIDAIESMVRSSYGDYSMGRMNIAEAMTSTDAVKLIPKVIEGKLR